MWQYTKFIVEGWGLEDGGQKAKKKKNAKEQLWHDAELGINSAHKCRCWSVWLKVLQSSTSFNF
jgi:hypothetical protein